METFGETLRSEREDRGLSIQAVAEILDVDENHLLALERNDFPALPDETVMLDCLQAYAACLQVDADLMIEDYQKERDRCSRRLAEAVTDVPSSAVEVRSAPPRVSRLLAALVIVPVVAIGAWWVVSRSGSSSTTTGAAPATAQLPLVPAEETPTTVEDRAEVAPPAPERPTERPAVVPAGPSIPDSGVGTAVQARQLVGRSERFTEGTRVWFWTSVQDGRAGDSIDHVWLREGAEVARVTLKIGGVRWRTHSAKMLHPGSAGNWAVEARDPAGRVLARHEFTCVEG